VKFCVAQSQQLGWILRTRFSAFVCERTDKQGKSGLGLEAQRKAVTDYLNGGDWDLVAEFTEIESGKKSGRPGISRMARATPCGAWRPNSPSGR
jgi:hypothetical protein